MLKKTIRRLGALAMVLAMAVSVFAVNASAAGTEVASTAVQKGKITKQITKASNVYAPKATFDFTISVANGQNGVTGGLTFANGASTAKISSNPANGDIGQTTVTAGSADLYVDLTKFTEPGVYNYTITENGGNYETGYAYGSIAKTVAVTVIRDDNNGGALKVAAVVFEGKKDNDEGKDEGVFTNDYTAPKNFDVKKIVAGDFGNRSKEFSITVTIKAAYEGKQFYLVDANSNQTLTAVKNENGDFIATGTVTLKHDQLATVYGVTTNDVITVTEAKYNDYEATISEEIRDDNGNRHVTVTNRATTNPPTGVIMTIAPYALMVVLAGAFAVVFLTRRNRAE